ncbi:MAG: ABC transporter ATP-binding protein [Oscillospiraceae bacterium]|nr:ABC transporter ATP-binding protein [Oscillospiraceae bacterium]
MPENKTIRWLYSVPGKKKLYIATLTAVQALNGASGVLYALLLREVVDAASAHVADGFRRYVIFLLALVCAQLAIRAVIRWLTELSKSTFENIFKKRLMDTLLHSDYLRVSAVHSAEWINRLTNDTRVVADDYVEILPGLCGMVVKLISALVMIIAMEPGFAAVIIPVGILLVIFSWLFRKVLKRLHKGIQESDGRLRIFLQERIGSMLMIRSFAAEDRTGEDAAARMEEHKTARMRRNRFSNICNIGFGAAMSGMYLLGVCWCGYGILTGTMTFGTLTAITQLISQIQSPFANITGYLPRFYAMTASAERLMEAESFDKDENEAKTPEEIDGFYRNMFSGIGLDGVSFRYLPVTDSAADMDKESLPPALEDLNLDIGNGEYVAFTGPSGCGKSTALKLLMCVYEPDSGERYYTDRKGNRYPLTSEYRRLFAYVPQGNVLMNGTIRDVVSFPQPEASHDDERLETALRIACADGFVSELEDGVETMLGERGSGLSEGQMQRLAIARAVFSGSPVLLLDEATGSLDADTESAVLRNLREMTDRTVVIVTHRTAAMDACDRVLEFTESGVIRHDR